MRSVAVTNQKNGPIGECALAIGYSVFSLFPSLCNSFLNVADIESFNKLVEHLSSRYAASTVVYECPTDACQVAPLHFPRLIHAIRTCRDRIANQTLVNDTALLFGQEVSDELLMEKSLHEKELFLNLWLMIIAATASYVVSGVIRANLEAPRTPAPPSSSGGGIWAYIPGCSSAQKISQRLFTSRSKPYMEEAAALIQRDSDAEDDTFRDNIAITIEPEPSRAPAPVYQPPPPKTPGASAL